MFTCRNLGKTIGNLLLKSKVAKKIKLPTTVLYPQTISAVRNNYFSTNKQMPKQEVQQLKLGAKEFSKNQVQDIIELSKIEDWQQIVANIKQPLLIEFYANWSIPCKKLIPKLEERARKANGSFKLLKVNIDIFGQIANAFKIKSVPAVFLVYGGKAIDSFNGEVSDEMLDKFLQNVIRVTKFGKLEQQIAKALEQAQIALQSHEYTTAQVLLTKIKTGGVKQEFGLIRNILLGFVYGQLGKISLLKALIQVMKTNESFYIEKGQFQELYLSLIQKCKQAEKAVQQNDQFKQWHIKIQANPQDLNLKYYAALFFKKNDLVEQALSLLLDIIKKNKDWQDKKANKEILSIFKELGNISPITLKYRKLLQRALY